MSGNTNKKNIAFCIGDIEHSSRFMRGFLDVIGTTGNANAHIFNSFVKSYDDTLSSKGGINIYNLPNYDIIDMLVVVPEYLSDNDEILDNVIKRALDAGKPVLCVGRQHEGCHSLIVDYDNRIEDICDHFIDHHGFRRINFLAGRRNNDVSESRIESYKRSLIKHGIEVDERRIYYGDFWETPAIEAVEEMLNSDLPMPEALVCANDAMALAAIKKLNERNIKVPSEICVSGLDGIDEALWYITTSTMLGEETGKKSAEFAIKLCDGEKLPTIITIPSKVEYGISCGCVKNDVAVEIEKRHNLYTNLYNSSIYSLRALGLTQEINRSVGFEDMVQSITDAMLKVWCDDLWVCICDDYITGFVSGDEINRNGADAAINTVSGNVHVDDYSEKMDCIVNIRDKQVLDTVVFDTAEMLPDFYNSADHGKHILYTPLQFNEKTIGYLAFNFYPWSDLDYVLNIVTSGMSYAIENARRQSDLLAYARMIDELYITDPLTTLYNRRGFFRFYGQYRDGEEKYDNMVISVDLDNLKVINDNFGHNEGDNAIKVVADALKNASLKDGDICARFGGDEYVVFGRCTCEPEMNIFMTNIRKYLDNYNRTSGKPYSVIASCGGCFIPKDTDKHIDYFINAADEKMYINKESHKRTREIRR